MPEALIWGASGGIGGALVRRLKADGWRVFAAARDESRIPSNADVSLHFHASQEYTFREVAMRVGMESSGLDLMVYAAGGMVGARVDEISVGDWTATFDSNLTGALRMVQASQPLLRDDAHVVFIGAYLDHLVLPKFAAYAAAKAGLEALVNILAKEDRRRRYTLVRPGAVDTAFWTTAPIRLPKTAKTPEAVAEAIVERAKSTSGGVLDL